MGAWVFRSQWHLPATPERVYAALADVAGYLDWWPQVRSARQIDEASGELVCRSRLPYDLRFVATREIEDPVGLVLRARLTGDLVGTSQWTIRPDPSAPEHSVAVFDEDVDLGKSLLRPIGRVLRRPLAANHEHMMRGGEAGLRAYLTGSPR